MLLIDFIKELFLLGTIRDEIKDLIINFDGKGFGIRHIEQSDEDIRIYVEKFTNKEKFYKYDDIISSLLDCGFLLDENNAEVQVRYYYGEDDFIDCEPNKLIFVTKHQTLLIMCKVIFDSTIEVI